MPFWLDGRPWIGQIYEFDNLYIVSGLCSSGFGREPMAGKLLAEHLNSGARPSVLDEADPARCLRHLE
jgi:glycine/D-amino acid oxidase-like deaminating enzyme